MLTLLKSILPSVLKSGEEVLKIYNSEFSVTYKKAEDPLTQADLLVHKILAESTEKVLPGSILLSEEGKIPQTSNELWILDPIDGTREFVKKNNQFAISLAYTRSDGNSMGIILNPATGDLFLGIQGMGVSFSKMQNPKFPDGSKPLEGIGDTPVSVLVSNTEFKENLFRDPLWKLFQLNPIGSIAYKLGLVGVGLHDLTISLKPKNDWDIAAGVIIVQAAGGKALSLDGEIFNFFRTEKEKKGILAGRKPIVDDLLDTHSEILRRDWREH